MTTDPPEARTRSGETPRDQAVPARRCRTCPVRDTSLCSALDDRDLAGLDTTRLRQVIPAGARIDHYGDACGNIVSGALKLSVHARDGREQIVGLLSAGDFFGAPFARDEKVIATALAETELCALSRDALTEALYTQPKLRRLLLKRAINALGEARDRLGMLGHASARERVAAFILDLVARAGDLTVRIPMRRSDVANFLGLTSETVSRELARLRAEGAIILVGARGCTVVDYARLTAIARR